MGKALRGLILSIKSVGVVGSGVPRVFAPPSFSFLVWRLLVCHLCSVCRPPALPRLYFVSVPAVLYVCASLDGWGGGGYSVCGLRREVHGWSNRLHAMLPHRHQQWKVGSPIQELRGAKIDLVVAPSGKARLKSFLLLPIWSPLAVTLAALHPGFGFSLDKYIMNRFPRLDYSMLSIDPYPLLYIQFFVIVRYPGLRICGPLD